MVRKLLAIAWITILLLGMAIAPGQRSYAEGTDGFELSVADAGERVDVTIAYKEAKDLYAYDLVLKFDPVRLAYEESKISLPGFTVKPLLERGELRLAHTSVGAAAGRNGKVELATIRFNRLRGGDADLMLETVKLVDSKLEMRELAPEDGVTVKSEEVVTLPSDVAGHWSEVAVREAMELGFVTGFDDGTFRPNAPVTRQEATVFLAKAMLLHVEGDPAPSFADALEIPSWAKAYVEAAVRAQWINGYGDGTFRGGQPIARQEFATIVSRSMGASASSSATGHAAVLSGFDDLHLLEQWAIGPTAIAVEHGIMRGMSGGLLKPQAATTRAEAVAMIMRLLYADKD